LAEPLSSRLGLSDRELVSLVGAGGKTTLMMALAVEGVESGKRVILTTTTKMGSDQGGRRRILFDPTDEELAMVLEEDGSCLVAAAGDKSKLLGLTPDRVDLLFASGLSERVLVEADGARGMQVKAPAHHEPVIPARTTTVLSLIGAGSIGRVIADVAHRPLRLAALLDCYPDERLTPEGAAALVLHAQGGSKGVPSDARLVPVVTTYTDEMATNAHRLVDLLEEGGLSGVIIDLRTL
jgi:probable selenium-dependent hydroxylase accessory protein YqeC